MKYETIKAKAIAAFSRLVDRELSFPGMPNDPHAPVSISMRALAADLGMTEVMRRETLAQVKDRGITLIEHWDVRNVAKLLQLFPSVAPESWKGKPLQAYMADNENGDWMVAPR